MQSIHGFFTALNDLVWGDFDKRIVMKFTRDVTADQIRGLP